MADKVISMEKVKAFWHSQVHDDKNFAANKKLVWGVTFFAASIVFMRTYGEMMALP